MMNRISNSSKLAVLTMVMIFAFGCKSSKKMEAAKAEEKARMEQEQQANLRRQKEEEAARIRLREAEELARREEDAKRIANEATEIAPKARLTEYFQAISNSVNMTSANNSINEALTLFASPETPVLIVISEYNNQKDYDRPTTIKDYLNYLKDQKKNANAISDLKFNSQGKITEVELRKPL